MNFFVGYRPRSGTEQIIGNRQTTDTIHQDWLRLYACFSVNRDDTGPFWGEMSIAPILQQYQHGLEIPASCGQYIFIARRVLAIATTFKQASLYQRVKSTRQHRGRNTEATLKFIETCQARKCIAQNQDAPPLADPIQTAGNGAFHFLKTCALHGSSTVVLVAPEPDHQIQFHARLQTIGDSAACLDARFDSGASRAKALLRYQCVISQLIRRCQAVFCRGWVYVL